ncbi:uncharacterized protein DS421_18g619370 [Arachis hypogaea]|nr:uncharacterized protein DS421_18g619370 [Arachis hypogaea]
MEKRERGEQRGREIGEEKREEEGVTPPPPAVGSPFMLRRITAQPRPTHHQSPISCVAVEGGARTRAMEGRSRARVEDRREREFAKSERETNGRLTCVRVGEPSLSPSHLESPPCPAAVACSVAAAGVELPELMATIGAVARSVWDCDCSVLLLPLLPRVKNRKMTLDALTFKGFDFEDDIEYEIENEIDDEINDEDDYDYDFDCDTPARVVGSGDVHLLQVVARIVTVVMERDWLSGVLDKSLRMYVVVIPGFGMESMRLRTPMFHECRDQGVVKYEVLESHRVAEASLPQIGG